MKRSPMQRTTPLRRDTGEARATVAIQKPKRCKFCRELFVRLRPLQVVCGNLCAAAMARAERQKEDAKEQAAERKSDRAKREAMKSRSQWLRKAQAAFNAWIRKRDHDKPCISCGRHHEGQWHAGHYLSTSARPELRFDEDNVHRQCQPCNVHLHGNLTLYRGELVLRRGLAVVERLEGPHDPKKFTVDQLKSIRDDYRTRVRAMEKAE